MRRSLLAMALGVTVTGCLVGDAGGPGAADDDAPGNVGENPGPGSPGSTTTPKLEVAVDRADLATELYSTNMVTLTLEGKGGFSGAVSLSAAATDAGGAPLAGWTVTLDKTSVEVAAGGSATAVATVKIPSDSAVMQGTVKISAQSALGTIEKVSAVTVAKQLTIGVTRQGDLCTYPANLVGTVNIAQGTKIRWVNNSTVGNVTFHVTDGIGGLKHQQGATAPGAAYEQTVTSTTGKVDWYCHDLNNPRDMFLQAAP